MSLTDFTVDQIRLITAIQASKPDDPGVASLMIELWEALHDCEVDGNRPFSEIVGEVSKAVEERSSQ